MDEDEMTEPGARKTTGYSPADQLSLPDDMPAHVRQTIQAQYQYNRAAWAQAEALDEIGSRLKAVEAILGPVAIAERNRLAARAKLAHAVSEVLTRMADCTRGTGESFAGLLQGIFSSNATKVVGALGLVLSVLSCAGVEMTVFDVNRAIDTLVGRGGPLDMIVGSCPEAPLEVDPGPEVSSGFSGPTLLDEGQPDPLRAPE